MSHIEDRGRTYSGKRWRVRWRSPDGTSHGKSFDRQADAQRFRREIESRAERGDSVDLRRGRITVDVWAQRWMNGLVLKPKTIATYESVIRSRVLPHWNGVALADIRHHDVQRWIADLQRRGLSASSIRQAHRALSQMLDAAVEDERIVRNRAQRIVLPAMPHRPKRRYLSHEEVGRLWDATGDVFIPFLAYTGLRWGEAVALERQHVDLGRRVVAVEQAYSDVNGQLILGPPKTHQVREVPMPSFVAESITLPASGPVFPAARGGVRRSTAYRRSIFDRGVLAAGVAPLTPHDLRHTAASLAVSAGANVIVLAAMLGHRDPSETLNRYADLFPNDLWKVAGLLDEAARASGLRPGGLRAVPA